MFVERSREIIAGRRVSTFEARTQISAREAGANYANSGRDTVREWQLSCCVFGLSVASTPT